MREKYNFDLFVHPCQVVDDGNATQQVMLLDATRANHLVYINRYSLCIRMRYAAPFLPLNEEKRTRFYFLEKAWPHSFFPQRAEKGEKRGMMRVRVGRKRHSNNRLGVYVYGPDPHGNRARFVINI